MSPTWVGTSWKMNKTLGQSQEFAAQLAREPQKRWHALQPFVIPPATAIDTVSKALGRESNILVGAQNAHWEDAGAWTGEISMPQIADAGAHLVELGHSERRTYFAETDETVNLKVHAALRHGLRPLVCVGEPESVKRAGKSVEYVVSQALAAVAGVDDASSVLIAYEPIWAIGELGRPAQPEDIAPTFEVLEVEMRGKISGLLYGGSVTLANSADLLAVSGVDGLFIGRAAWAPTDFVKILDTIAEAS